MEQGTGTLQAQCWGSSTAGNQWIRGSGIHALITFSKYENENGRCNPSRLCEKKSTFLGG